jgi:hypothetical protein
MRLGWCPPSGSQHECLSLDGKDPVGHQTGHRAEKSTEEPRPQGAVRLAATSKTVRASATIRRPRLTSGGDRAWRTSTPLRPPTTCKRGRSVIGTELSASDHPFARYLPSPKDAFEVENRHGPGYWPLDGVQHFSETDSSRARPSHAARCVVELQRVGDLLSLRPAVTHLDDLAYGDRLTSSSGASLMRMS